VGVAVFWPAAGIAVAALIVFARKAGLAIAAAVAIATIAAAIGRSPWLAIAFGLVTAGQALLTAHLIERWFNRPFAFDGVRPVFGLLAAAVLAAAAAAVGGATAMTLLSNNPAPFWEVWRTWFLSVAVGVMVVAPLLIGLAQLWRERPSQGEWIEGVGVLALLGLASHYTVTSPPDSWITFSPSALVLPFLLWLTARCRPAFAIAGAFVASAAVLLAITFGVGRFGDASVAITERITGAQAAMTVVTLFTLLLAALFTERQRNETKLRRAEERQRLLVAELNHRVRNALATVAAVASRTQNASLSAKDFAAKLAGRIQSMAATHDAISRREWNGIAVRELVQRELAPYMAENNTEPHGPDLTLSPNAGQALSMVLHELATNAAKHGALSTDGRVSVRWRRAQNPNACLCIEWQESGGPTVQSPQGSGYGTDVIHHLIPYELGGTVELAFASEGLRCTINIPGTEVSQ
jgi:two-component sensor histidine kinase/integral membrane sensor domain MASE1